MKNGTLALRLAMGMSVLGGILAAGEDRAEPTLVIQTPEPRHYAEPPLVLPPDYVPPPAPIAISEPQERPAAELPRSDVRLQLDTAGISTGRGLGAGLGVAADFGHDMMGFRASAAWVRGEPDTLANPSPVSQGLSQYAGELTMDVLRHGPLHPVFGLGFGLAHVSRANGVTGDMGVGIGSLTLQYATPIEQTDLRWSVGVTGALPGPAATAVSDVRGYAIFHAGVALGF